MIPKTTSAALKLFTKAQISSIIATLIDFSFTYLLTSVFGLWYLFSCALGALAGAILNFIAGRLFVFKATKQSARLQAYKYALVWIGSLVLNVLGVYLFTEDLNFNYMLSKTIVAVVIAVFYNYYLQKMYVFKDV